jgi:two-component system sensor histidine kinase QseC
MRRRRLGAPEVLETMKILLGILAVLLVIAAVVIVRLARRIERARRALDAKKAAYQKQLREEGSDAEMDYIAEEIDRALRDDATSTDRAERLLELKTVLQKNRAAEIAPFDAAGACADVVEAWRRQAPDEEIFFCSPAGGSAEVAGDPDLFRWAIRELFSNVMAHGGVWSRIAVDLKPGDGVTVLSFTDDGEGPDLTTTSRLYGAFTPRIESEGPGLGLFAVRAIVERMGGSIHASPGDDGGLRHTVRLPAGQPSRPQSRPAEAASRV